MTCIECTHWNLRESPLRVHGFGLCKADPNPLTAKGRTWSGANECRLRKFAPAASSTVAKRREVLA